jgi:Fe-S-cluster containining protein
MSRKTETEHNKALKSRPPGSVAAVLDVPTWVASACTRCGKCCTNEHYMQTLSATEADLNRWHAEGRTDILKYADVIVPGAGADLWVTSEGKELSRCPFLRKDRKGGKYKCRIYETRPEACRGYPHSVLQMIRDECEILVELDKMTGALKKARKPGAQEAEDAAERKILLAQSDSLPRRVSVRVKAARAK